MILADSSSMYIVPGTAVVRGTSCSVCQQDEFSAEQLVLVSSIVALDDTYLSHTHIDCIQNLVVDVPSVYNEFEALRESYLAKV